MGFFGRKKESSSGDPENGSPQTALAQALAQRAAHRPVSETAWEPPPREFVELGTIRYVNLTQDGRHGKYQTALDIAAETGKPIFANFVEWSG